MGIRVTKKDLLPGSVPTIQKCFTPATSTNGSTIGTDSTVTSVASQSQTTCTVVTTTRKRPLVSCTVQPVTSKPRTAYAKREHQRPKMPVKKCSKGTQVDPPMRHKGVQTYSESRKSTSTQCQLTLETGYQHALPTSQDDKASSATVTPALTPVKAGMCDPEWSPMEEESEEEFDDPSTIEKSHTWDSQPFIKDIPAGNILMSSSILFSGALPSKVFRFLHHFNVAAISDDAFFDHQSAFVCPSIDMVWHRFRNEYITFMRERCQPLVLGGDGRADTPGHSAKFGTYSLLDMDIMKVVDVQLVQSNVAGGSVKMELKGLQDSIQSLADAGLTVGQLVTDRHPSIIKWVREHMQGTQHSFDVWHVVKGLKKKLLKLACEKECGALQQWIKSICNHLYWVAVSTPNADGQLMLEKWCSLSNHLHNKHQHKGAKFPRCQHPDLEGEERNKNWIKAGTKLSAKLTDILESRQMMKDVPMLSTGPQTASIEGFHSVLNHFAPKMYGFSYSGILHRNVLAALHFNENNERKQATRLDGTPRFRVAFKKARKSFALEPVKISCTYGYVDELQEQVVELASVYSIREIKELLKEHEATHAPPPLCVDYEHLRPGKAEAIQAHLSRFKK
ncbi:hypothetical protein BaRGS_00033055 [Batillaria attramentaria]|uniref:Transposase n=1 Tax=Batillaria attramentaria TaxID=370345 RepID=A0ABD0JL22_9CAEN